MEQKLGRHSRNADEIRSLSDEYMDEIDTVIQGQGNYEDKSEHGLERKRKYNRKSSHMTDEEEYWEEDDSVISAEMEQVKREQSGYEDASSDLEDEKDNAEKCIQELSDAELDQKNYADKTEYSEDMRKDGEGQEYVEELESIAQDQMEYNDKSENTDERNAGHVLGEEAGLSTDTVQTVVKDISDKVPYEFALEILSRNNIRYLDSPKTSKLYIFNGMIWEPLQDAEDMASIIYKEMSVKEKRTQQNIDGFCKKVASFIKLECKERNESGNERFLEEDFKKIENRISFRNCVYDIKTRKTMQHDRCLPYYIGIDTDYMEEDMDTPMFDKLKSDATGGDEKSMDMFDLMLGYLMIPNRSGKCYFVMADARDSGKSIFGHFIESIYMGNRVKTINLEHLAGRFSMADTDSVVLLSGLEVNTDRLTLPAVAQIKRITGESKIRMEAKYKGEQDVNIRFKLILATNGAMLLPGNMTDHAFYRRTVIIPFIKSTPPSRIIADMPKLLQDEKSAILSKAARRIGAIVNQDGGIHFPESRLSLRMKDAWIGMNDHAEKFIKDFLAYTARKEDALLKEDIYGKYQSWFKKHVENNLNATMLTKNELMRKIMEIYPGVSSKKLRRKNTESESGEGAASLRPCLTCLKWNELLLMPIIG